MTPYSNLFLILITLKKGVVYLLYPLITFLKGGIP